MSEKKYIEIYISKNTGTSLGSNVHLIVNLDKFPHLFGVSLNHIFQRKLAYNDKYDLVKEDHYVPLRSHCHQSRDDC